MDLELTADSRKAEVKELLHERSWAQLRERIADWEPPEVADLLMEVEKAERVLLFRTLPRPLSSEAAAYLDALDLDSLLRDLTDAESRSLLENLRPDDRTELLSELPGTVTQRLLNLLGPEDLAEARRLLGYPEESVGRLMTPEYVAIRPEWSIRQALHHIRARGQDSETINRIYVVDAGWHLIDDIPLRRLIIADPEKKVSEVMDHKFISLSAFDDREEAVRRIQRYDQVALPVVDSGGVLLGIVTVDDLLDVAEEEATEDFHKAASVAPLKMSYWEATLWTLYRMRIGWLAALVLVNLLSSGVIAAFEETLAATVALAFFIPLIIDTGGNTGTQSAIIIIRGISTGDIQMREWARTFFREMLLGAMIGASLGAMGMVLGMFRGGFEVGLIVFVTLMAMITVTNLVGMLLPFVLARLRIDPAVASGPLITSIADFIGLVIYFSIASLLL